MSQVSCAFIIATFLLFMLGCKPPPEPVNKSYATRNLMVNADSLRSAKEADSLESAFENGEVVYASIIRLPGHVNAFIDVDTVYGVHSFLLKDSADNYYKMAQKFIHKEDLKVYNIVWSLPEIQSEAGSIWGGYHGAYARIDGRPSDEGSDGYYRVVIKRSYEQREGRVFPIGFLRIKLHPRRILIERIAHDDFIELSQWRRLHDDEKE